jgi:O-antigen/teichoic acid export membrane protein
MVAGAALAGLGLLFQNVQLTLSISLMSRLRLGWVTAIELLRQVVTVAVIVALVVAGASLLPFLATPIPAGLAILVFTAVLVRGQVPLAPAFRWSEWAPLLRETLPFAAATAVGVVYFRVAIVLVSITASAAETGYFGASFRIVDVLVVVPQLLVGAAFPIFARAARDDHARLGYALDRVFQASLIVGVWIALALALAASPAIRVVAGPDFAPAADVLRIQGVAVAAAFLSAVFAYGLLSLRHHRTILVVNLVGLTVSAALTAVLSSAAGAQGAAVATAIAEVVLVSSLAAVLIRRHPVLRPSLAAVPRVALAAVLAGATVLIPGIPDLVAAALATLIYGGALVVLRAVPPELLAEIRRRRPGLS